MTLTKGWNHPDAECLGADPNWFIPELRAKRNFTPDPRGVALCNRCPVRDECLEHAVTHHEAGLWAGTNDAERDHIRRTNNIRPDSSRSRIANLLDDNPHREYTTAELANHIRLTKAGIQTQLYALLADGTITRRIEWRGSRRTAMWGSARKEVGVNA